MNHIQPLNSRIKILETLSKTFNTPYFLTNKEKQLEQTESLKIPTIGTEIEIFWRHILEDYENWFLDENKEQILYSQFNEEKKNRFQKRCQEVDKKYKNLYEKTVECGIPKGGHCGYHEFANKPVNWHKTLCEEIRILQELDLIKKDQEHPLHITLGGVELTPEIGILATILEINGASTKKRLELPLNQKKAWARKEFKSKGGILQRTPHEIEGRFSTGVEFRTFSYNSQKQFENTLRTAQLYGACILAREEKTAESQLKEIWKNSRNNTLEKILKPLNLNCWMKSPFENKDQWQAYTQIFSNSQLIEEIKYKTEKDLDRIEEIILNN